MQKYLTVILVLFLSACTQSPYISTGNQVSNTTQNPELIPEVQLQDKLTDLTGIVSNLDVCRIQEVDKVQNYSQQKGFPYFNSVAINGEVNIGIIAVDFPH